MKAVNYYKIGAFVVLILVFLIVILVAIGTLSFFQPKRYVETYFDESVQGLKDGSPVKYLGIDIGHIDKIGLVGLEYPEAAANNTPLHHYIYVRMMITYDNFANKQSERFWNSLPEQIKKGLRVQITPQGVTGGAFLNISFLNAKQNPPLKIAWKPKDTYIPSATSSITRITDGLNNFFGQLQKADIPQLTQNLNQLTLTINKAVKAANAPGISEQTRNALKQVASTLKQYRSLANRLTTLAQKPQVGETIDNLANITQTLKQTTKEATKTLQVLNHAIINSNQILAEFRVNEQTLLNNTNKTAENLRTITNNAKENPAGVLFSSPPPHLDPGTL